ncbi:hypothetical protein Vadar_001099 [Vaccinium darrowii]|uniref:Uncharacterized protein n=1 Tax=Vaccinium darrowii TaxID=229202 RepID=A0ACB7WXA4_9ERIC|nr:hypothetical protein Vadar_001099 [Vaccinium darrowii]
MSPKPCLPNNFLGIPVKAKFIYTTASKIVPRLATHYGFAAKTNTLISEFVHSTVTRSSRGTLRLISFKLLSTSVISIGNRSRQYSMSSVRVFPGIAAII